MKITFAKPCQGNVLLFAVFTMMAVGAVLVAYLSQGATHHRLTARSQVWNAALPVAEAGLEEALTQLNYTLGKNLDANGWSKCKGGVQKTRYLSTNAYYTATIEGSGKKVDIVATGYQRDLLSGQYISRTITAACLKTNVIFIKAMIAKKHIRCGKASLLDSFDSGDAKYSTGGKYDPAKRKDTASVGATSTKKNAIKVDKTKIYGEGSTSKKGNIEFKDGSIGDLAWVNGGNKGGQPGKIHDDLVYDFPVVMKPFTTASDIALVNGKYGKTDYQYLLGTGDYQLDGKVELKKPLIVKTNCNAVLYVTGDFKASEDIIISKGGSLKLYMAGKKFEVASKDIVVNDGEAGMFQYYGLPSNKEVKMTKKGDSVFHGVIYAPNAKIKIEGENDVIGAVVGKCVHMKHNGAFHFDEGLWGKDTDYDMYIVSGWTEQ